MGSHYNNNTITWWLFTNKPSKHTRDEWKYCVALCMYTERGRNIEEEEKQSKKIPTYYKSVTAQFEWSFSIKIKFISHIHIRYFSGTVIHLQPEANTWQHRKKTDIWTCVTSDNSEQLVHLHSLISIFTDSTKN